jgi:apoptosis-inducing factor 2
MSKKSVVVVGGGGAGAAIARALSAKLEPSTATLTLVTARPFSVFLPASIRMTTTSEGSLEETALLPYDKLFINKNGTVKVARVVSIENHKEDSGGTLILSDGEKLHYDVLIVAPGSLWEGPLNFPDTKAEVLDYIKDWRQSFEKAQSIVLAGGGAVALGTSWLLGIVDSLPHLTGILQSMPARSRTTIRRRRLPLFRVTLSYLIQRTPTSSASE